MRDGRLSPSRRSCRRAAAEEADAAPTPQWADDDVLRNLDALKHAEGSREGGDDEAGLAGPDGA